MPKVLPTQKNVKRHSAMLFAGVTAITLAGLVAFLSVKPKAYIGSRGVEQIQPTFVPQLLLNCEYSYVGCHNSERIFSLADTRTAEQYKTTGESYQINPVLLFTLAEIEAEYTNSSLDQIDSKEIAANIKQIYNDVQTNHTTFHHPIYGTFLLADPTKEVFVITQILAAVSQNQSEFTQLIAAPIETDEKVVGFIERFNLNSGDK